MRAPFLRLLVTVCLLGGTAWALVPSGAAGEEYPLPTPPTGPLPKLAPFPQIRIAGVVTRRSTRIKKLTVRATVGVLIVSRCKGGRSKRCPYRQKIQTIAGQPGATRLVKVAAFQRRFRPGARLRLYVVRDGRTGKYTSFLIRRQRVPSRRDRCVRGRILAAIRCPT